MSNVINEIDDIKIKIEENKGYFLEQQYRDDLKRLLEVQEILNKYDELFDLCFGQYSSIDDFEQAKKEYLGEG